MLPIEMLTEIESNYNVKDIEVNGFPIWGLLRNIYGTYFYSKMYVTSSPQKISQKIHFRRLLRNFSYGFSNLFRKVDIFIFTDILERKKLNKKRGNRLFDSIISNLRSFNLLVIEKSGNTFHFDKKDLSFDKIISMDLFNLLCKFSYFNKKINVKNEYILRKIQKKYQINFNYKRAIASFLCYYKIFYLFFTLKKPKVVFLSDYYNESHQAVILSANRLKIPTIELQHGMINDKLHAYLVNIDLNEKFYPNFLFTFGKETKKIFDKKNLFISEDNVFQIGNSYLNYIYETYSPPKKLAKTINFYKKKYRKLIGITSQWTIEPELISFVIQSAKKDKNNLYIFIPRFQNQFDSNLLTEENIITLGDLNFYQILKIIDIHATVYSFCAMEAPIFGIPNILININNLSVIEYSFLLDSKNVTKLANSPQEFIEVINNWSDIDSKEIQNSHKKYFEFEHKKYLKKALRAVISQYNETVQKKDVN